MPSIFFTKDSHVLLPSDTNMKRCSDSHVICFSVVTVKLKEQDEALDKTKPANLQEMLQHMEKWSRSIEVVYYTEEQKQILTRVYFPFDPKVGWS